MPAPNLLGRDLADQTGECLASHSISLATPGINHHSPLGIQISLSPSKKKKRTINKELTHSRGVEFLKVHHRRQEEQSANLHVNFQ
jgi:hypothetical protein